MAVKMSMIITIGESKKKDIQFVHLDWSYNKWVRWNREKETPSDSSVCDNNGHAERSH